MPSGFVGSCKISIKACNLELKIVNFQTHVEDTLTMDGEVYSGDHRPASGTYTRGDIFWNPGLGSAKSGRSGWEMCRTHAPWTVSGGGCVMEGDCISSSADPSLTSMEKAVSSDITWDVGKYGNDQRCVIRIQGTLDLSIEAFHTEEAWDTLEMGGQSYSGDVGPPSGTYSGDIVWNSDYSVAYSGWKFCKARPPWIISGPCELHTGKCVSAFGTHSGCTIYIPDWLELSVEEFTVGNVLPTSDRFTMAGDVTPTYTKPPDGTYSGTIRWAIFDFADTIKWKICRKDLPWTIVGDGCVMHRNCISSAPAGPESDQYRNDASCTIHIVEYLELTVKYFETELNFDVLTIVSGKHSAHYSGSRWPYSGSYSAGEYIKWSTDSKVARSGWKICKDPLQDSLKFIA